ncbi:hypothetical protein GCM10009117_01280 [Gangjinia marincola]|uniref:Uncharacterized protein n=1 Tax=Gangjinia marincola TaxID=578463 RepID=A0ABN1MD02_9FLAO
MDINHYTTLLEVKRDLRKLKLEKEIAFEEIKFHYNNTSGSSALGSATMNLLSGLTKKLAVHYIYRKLFK